MRSVGIHEAKTRVAALIQAVAAGEEVVITNRNRPVARLVPVDPPREPPVFGADGADSDAMIGRYGAPIAW